MEYDGKKVLIVGMARSGAAAARLLGELGADVWLYDVKAKEQLPEEVIHALTELDYHDLLGKDPLPAIEQMDALVLSPGVPLGLPFIQRAYELNKKVIAEIELGFTASKADFIAITGTNGKTTTTALVGDIFKNAGINTFVLGNIGVPITQEALRTKPGDVVVAETAALQLDTIDEYRPKGSAILNITEDHMDRYGKMENYIAAKAKIFKNQMADDYCVLNYDNDTVRELAAQVRAQVFWFSLRQSVENGAFVRNGKIVFARDGREVEILPVEKLHIPGRHNLENALAAAALACIYGIDSGVVAHTLKTFKGVEHRIEFVREVGGVTFINDSKGTNPDATLSAVRAMDKPTVLLLGGYDKKSDFEGMFRAFTPNVRATVVMGATTNKIVQAAQNVGYENYILATGFEDAVLKAYSIADEGGVVLLSPACASWDMFADFEERGRAFKEIVRGL
ncbi:MAG TPA: UDP-N-acetylmuramoyl-L-alanine--D-glutamate ligase [Clostridiales bacterium]|nr:UDP-N-acetylmuramoyl-L-alanine--D-glutamate ligase [Clostridiales bacterium]